MCHSNFCIIKEFGIGVFLIKNVYAEEKKIKIVRFLQELAINVFSGRGIQS